MKGLAARLKGECNYALAFFVRLSGGGLQAGFREAKNMSDIF